MFERHVQTAISAAGGSTGPGVWFYVSRHGTPPLPRCEARVLSTLGTPNERGISSRIKDPDRLGTDRSSYIAEARPSTSTEADVLFDLFVVSHWQQPTLCRSLDNANGRSAVRISPPSRNSCV